MIRLVIHTLPPSNNEIKRMHWAVYKRLRNTFRWALLEAAGPATFTRWWEADPPPKVEARITVYRGKGAKMLDEDNLSGGMKPLIDAMKDVGLIRNDSPRWFRLIPDQKRDRENPRVEIELETIS